MAGPHVATRPGTASSCSRARTLRAACSPTSACSRCSRPGSSTRSGSRRSRRTASRSSATVVGVAARAEPRRGSAGCRSLVRLPTAPHARRLELDARPARRARPRRRRQPHAAPDLWRSSSRSTRARPASARSPSTTTAGRAHASYREFPQHFPQPGWVEHDADDIWRVTARDARPRSPRELDADGRDGRRDRHHQPARDGRRLGPRAPGGRVHRAIVWQDRRTAARCDELRAAGHEPMIRARDRARARPVLLGDEARVAAARRRRRGRRRPRVRHRRHVDPVEAHRRRRRRRARDRSVEREPHDALRHRRARLVGRAAATLFDVPRACLPEVLPSSGRFGVTRPELRGRARACR